MSSKPKYLELEQSLLAGMHEGKFGQNQKIPSEYTLAKEHGVSYLTARRAVSRLVDRGILSRRGTRGTFVSDRIDSQLGKKVFHVICSSSDSWMVRSFLNAAKSEVKKMGGVPHVVRVNSDETRQAESMLASGETCLVLANRALLSGSFGESLLRNSANPVVLVGSNLASLGVRSVLCDDAHAVNYAMNRLRRAGHRRIGFIVFDPEHPVQKVMISAWRQACRDSTEEQLTGRLLIANASSGEDIVCVVRDTVTRYLRSSQADVTAFFCLYEGALAGIAAACRECKLKIPEDLSVVSFGDSHAMRFFDLSPSYVDPDVAHQTRYAVEMLAENMDKAPLLHLVEPVYVNGETVTPCKEQCQTNIP